MGKTTSISAWTSDLKEFNQLRAIETGKKKKQVSQPEMFHELLEEYKRKD